MTLAAAFLVFFLLGRVLVRVGWQAWVIALSIWAVIIWSCWPSK